MADGRRAGAQRQEGGEMRVMGVDPSTKTGVVVLQGDEIIEATVCSHESENTIERATAISRQVKGIAKEYKVSFIIIEDYAYHGNRGSLVTLAEIGTMIRWRLWADKIPYLAAAPNTVKKFVAGAGNAPKDQMRLAVWKRWAFEDASMDVVDAFAMAKTAQALVWWEQALKKDQEALKTLRKQWDKYKLTDILK